MGRKERPPTAKELATVVCTAPQLKIMFTWYAIIILRSIIPHYILPHHYHHHNYHHHDRH
jgi:hypothetical protein